MSEVRRVKIFTSVQHCGIQRRQVLVRVLLRDKWFIISLIEKKSLYWEKAHSKTNLSARLITLSNSFTCSVMETKA